MLSATSLRSWLLRVGLVGVAGVTAFSVANVSAVHEDLEFPAAIHEGTCEDPGDVAFELENLVRLPEDAPEEGDRVGAPLAQVVHGSPDESSIEASIDDLFADDHVLAVFNAEGEEIVACGPVGAYTFDDGDSLAIGLREQNDSNFSGVAFFEGADDNLDVDVFLVSSTLPPAASPEATPEA